MSEALKEFLKELKASKEFKQFIEKKPLAYNTSASFIDEKWQLDFYDPDSDKITSFTKKEDEILSEESEVFRKEKKEIPELKVDKIKFNLNDVEELMKQKLKEEPTKKIIVLQQNINPYWNITYLTKRVEIINIKIDAVTQEILDESIESALAFTKN